MQIESKDGNMVLNYYPTKGWDNIINTDQFLKTLTFRGRTIIKRVISNKEYIKELSNRIAYGYVITDNSMLPQFTSAK